MNDFSDKSCSSKYFMGDLLRDFEPAILRVNMLAPSISYKPGRFLGTGNERWFSLR